MIFSSNLKYLKIPICYAQNTFLFQESSIVFSPLKFAAV